ncbi:MAG: hypothetical protein K2H23_00745 [Oscillospiraceae bacterium]|nr:hypothetical protein [Oscillospiraceae bacterium]
MSYILPIGVGISGSMENFGGSSYGMGVYRKNSIDAAKAVEQLNDGMQLDPVKNSANDQSVTNGKISNEADRKRRFDSYECQTCKNRRYQDGSDDSGVSFQTPTKVDPKSAGAAVRGHEQEHVSRNHSKAERDGKEIVSQSVTIHTGICPECGKVYISGGTTRTTTRNASDDRFNIGISDPSQDSGRMFNAVA